MVPEDSGRRSFFRLLTRDLLVEAEEVRGVRHVTYGEVLAASDEKLGWLVPIIRQGIVIRAYYLDSRIERFINELRKL